MNKLRIGLNLATIVAGTAHGYLDSHSVPLDLKVAIALTYAPAIVQSIHYSVHRTANALRERLPGDKILATYCAIVGTIEGAYIGGGLTLAGYASGTIIGSLT